MTRRPLPIPSKRARTTFSKLKTIHSPLNKMTLRSRKTPLLLQQHQMETRSKRAASHRNSLPLLARKCSKRIHLQRMIFSKTLKRPSLRSLMILLQLQPVQTLSPPAVYQPVQTPLPHQPVQIPSLMSPIRLLVAIRTVLTHSRAQVLIHLQQPRK